MTESEAFKVRDKATGVWLQQIYNEIRDTSKIGFYRADWDAPTDCDGFPIIPFSIIAKMITILRNDGFRVSHAGRGRAHLRISWATVQGEDLSSSDKTDNALESSDDEESALARKKFENDAKSVPVVSFAVEKEEEGE